MINKIAFGNIIKHKWSSLIILMVFAVSSFVIYWAFGFSNNFSESISESSFRNNGHLVYVTDFISKAKGSELYKSPSISEVVFERRVSVVSSSKKESGMLSIGEMTPKYMSSLTKIKLEQGRLPEKSDEIVITTQYDETKLTVGDYITVTAFTPDKVVNAVRYKVVGLGKIGAYSMVTSESMTNLICTNDYFNTAVIYAAGKIDENTINALDTKLKDVLKNSRIKIDESSNFYKEMRENKEILAVFEAMKFILLAVMFPLTGAILGALVWIHSFRRRKELWTYHSMGFKDRHILRIVTAEYLIIAFAGTITGILFGMGSSAISESMNTMLSFTYILNTVIVAKIGFADIFFIFTFVVINTVFWLQFPVKRIIKSKPFSY